MSDSDTKPKPKPWDRLEDETDAAYEAFVNYIEMPASKRSQKNMVAKYYANSAAKLRWVNEWSVKYDWVRRANKYETWRQKRRLEIQHQRLEEAQEAISDELLALTRTSITGAQDGSLTGPQVAMLRDLLDRAGLEVVQKHEVSHSISTKDLDSLIGIHRPDE